MTLAAELRANRSVLGGICLIAVLYMLVIGIMAAPTTVPLPQNDLLHITGAGFNYAEAAGWMAVGAVAVIVVAVAIAPPLAPAIYAGCATVASLGAADMVIGAAAFGLYKLASRSR